MKLLYFILIIVSVSLITGEGKEIEMKNAEEITASLEEEGEFNVIREKITRWLEEKDLAESERKDLQWEKERIDRIEHDYRFTRNDLLEQLERRVEGFEPDELEKWTEEGKLTSRIINGERRYFYAAVSNMFFRHSEIYKRNIGFERKNPHPDLVHTLIHTPRFKHDFYLKPIRRTLRFDLEITESLSEGDELEVWIPYPRSFPFQTDIQTVSASSDLQFIAPAESPMRTAYFKRTYEEPGDEKFHISFSYTAWARYRDIGKENIQAIDKECPEKRYFLEERQPHIVFHPDITTIVDEITENVYCPYLKARKIYDWMIDNFQYSFAPEYSTQRNISHETFTNRYGDCGQLTLLFMTMLRYAGIPARWQSGWVVYPHRRGLHDWCEMYIPPYGWLPVDITVMIGIQSRNQDQHLKEDTVHKIRDFYFGNMHPHVFVANNDYGRAFIPDKSDFRSDTVDSQRGEVEVNGKNIYYPGFSRSLTEKESSFVDHR